MSLRVWLPLNGNLNNQGLSNITVTNNGAAINDSGKIGSCYYFNGSAQYLQFSDSLGNIYSNDFSWTVWLKPTDDTRGIIISEYSSAGASNVAFELLANRVIRVYWNGSPDWSFSAIPKDVWSHVAITKHVNTIKVYINGVESGSKTTTLSARPSTAKIRIGDDYRGGTNVSYMGYMNDVRIYDHALSAKEVEEIAKGLMLHYKLDTNLNVLDNCYNYPTFNTSTTSGGWSHWGPSGHAGTYSQNTDKQYIYNKANTYSHCVDNTASATGKYYLCYQSPAFDGGYRSLQFIIKEANGLPITETICYPGWNARNGGAPNSKWTYIINLGDGFYLCQVDGLSQDGSNDLVGIDVSAGYKIYISEGYLENNREICSDIFNQNNLNTIYDSSGYGNNGTIIGSLTTSTPSPRYNYVTYFTATTSKILIENLNTSGFANSYSFTWWGKINTFSNKMFWGFADGVRLNGIYNGNLWNTGDGASNPLYTPGTTTQVTAPSLNTWHHFAMVGNGTMCVVYLDGELWGQAKTYKSISGTKIYMNGWDSGTSYTTNDMSISDFRIYATALTPEQIKELYNTSMSIDNNGNIHVRELVEL